MKKNVTKKTQIVETVTDFLKRGGKITMARSRRAHGAQSIQKMPRALRTLQIADINNMHSRQLRHFGW